MMCPGAPDHQLKIVLAVCLSLGSACSWYQETYRNPDRDCGPAGAGVLPSTSCRAFIQLACPATEFPPPPSEGLFEGVVPTVYVRPVKGPEQPLVGDLYAHFKPFPIYVRGASPWRVLQLDVERILRERNVGVAAEAERARYVLAPDFTYLLHLSGCEITTGRSNRYEGRYSGYGELRGEAI